MRRFLLILLMFCVKVSFGGGADYQISKPLNITDAGSNKLLQVRNGNLLLFRFEAGKGLLVKVFDENLEEQVSQWHTGNALDLREPKGFYFDGLHEIGKEAVLFVSRRTGSAESLYRLRFDTQTGALISEENISRIEALPTGTMAFVLKERKEDIYYVPAFTKTTVQDAALDVLVYDNEHKRLKRIPVDMVKKGYDEIHLLSQQIDRTGALLLSAELTKRNITSDLPEKYLVLYYLAPGAEKFVGQILKLPAGARDFTVNFTDNAYAGTVNVFLSAIADMPGQSESGERFFYRMLIITDHELNVLNQVQLTAAGATQKLAPYEGSDVRYAGSILSAALDNKGNTIVISEDLVSATEPGAKNMSYADVAAYDYEGVEKRVSVLPLPLRAKSIGPDNMFLREVDERSKLLSIITEKNSYLIFNEPEENFSRGLGDTLLQPGNYGNTSAVYYRVDKKGKTEKVFLCGRPEPGKHKSVHPLAGSYDAKRNVYATIVSILDNDNLTMHVMRCKLKE